jgi:alkylhydroperoxidase family enzyme
MLEFADKLTRAPGQVSDPDVDELRRLGFDDEAIHDITQVTALFNYFDRLADGLGCEPEPEWVRNDTPKL